ncbi:MAG: hypothetical protein LBK99_11645 [Opitutaceae bacterium]|jgi:hypothetical protein|nr:hypothetical protein [Opitutaceae bacterium]
MNRMTCMKHKNIPFRSGKRAIMTTVLMAIVSIVMSGTKARAGFSLEGYSFTLASIPWDWGETANITNNGFVALAGEFSFDNYLLGYWDTGKDTVTYINRLPNYPRVNSSGIIMNEETAYNAKGEKFYAYPSSKMWDINDAGIAVGCYGSNNASVWESATAQPTLLPYPDNHTGTGRFHRISNNGIIAGSAVSGGVPMPVMWNAERDFIPLPTVSGATLYNIAAINDAGVIAGNVQIVSDYWTITHAYVWDAGAEEVILTDLEAIAASALGDDETIHHGTVDGINESGILTGSLYINGTSQSNQRGVMWVPKEGEAGYDLIDVTRLAKEAGLLVEGVGTDEGLTAILTVSDINDHNQIVGTGLLRILSERWVDETWVEVEGEDGEWYEVYIEGHYEPYYANQQVAFLLNPGSSQVPEPGATGAVAGVVALLAACAAMRRRPRRRQRGRGDL